MWSALQYKRYIHACACLPSYLSEPTMDNTSRERINSKMASRNTGEPALENEQNPSLSLHLRTPTRTHFKNGLADKPP